MRCLGPVLLAICIALTGCAGAVPAGDDAVAQAVQATLTALPASTPSPSALTGVVEVTRTVPIDTSGENVVTATPRSNATALPAPRWHAQDAIAAFQAAGLEAERPRPMTPKDYGLAPRVASEAIRFFIPSLCSQCGGRVYSFSNDRDLQLMVQYYQTLSDTAAVFASWVLVRDNLLVHINGSLPQDQALRYQAALAGLE